LDWREQPNLYFHSRPPWKYAPTILRKSRNVPAPALASAAQPACAGLSCATPPQRQPENFLFISSVILWRPPVYFGHKKLEAERFMFLFGALSFLQQWFAGIKKRREKALPVHFTPPSIADQPIPTPETSTFVYRRSTRGRRNLGIAFLALLVVGISGMAFLWSDVAFVISWCMVCVGLMGAFICWVQYNYLRRILYCVDPHGLISQHPACTTLIARWADIFEISIHEINAKTRHLNVELWDRSQYMVICPAAGRKETVRVMRACLPRDRYAQAEQLIRQWETGIND
jgi:hypothetical protein